MMNRINVNAEQIRDDLGNLAHAALSSAFKSLFNDIEKKLFSRAEHTIHQEDKAEFFELIESLKTHLQPFEDDFFATVSRNDLGERIPKTWVDLIHDRTLSLLIEDMVAHAKARYGMEHAQYESRIKLLSQSYPTIIGDQYLTLPGIVTAFLINLKHFKKPLKKDIIRVLGNQVLIKLEPMYMLMNDHLVQLGVLPQIKSVRETELSAIDSLFNDLFDREHALMGLETGTAVENHVVPLEILQDLLKRKKLILRKASDIQPDDFTDALAAEIDKQHKNATVKPAIASKDKEILRLVGAVIADIINDPQINPVIKKQIHLLQTVLLYTAFDDPNFFSQINNPARTTINELAVIGSDPSLDIDKISQIEKLVGEIITDATNLNFSFAQALRALYRIDGRAAKNDELALNAIQNRHPEVLARCRNRIAAIIREKAQDTVMNPPAQAFIEEIWAPFMVQILMTHGRQCDEWHEANSVLDRVIRLEKCLPDSPKSLIELDSHIKELLRHSQNKRFQLESKGNSIPAIENYRRHLEAAINAIPDEPEPEAVAAQATDRKAIPEAGLPPQADSSSTITARNELGQEATELRDESHDAPPEKASAIQEETVEPRSSNERHDAIEAEDENEPDASTTDSLDAKYHSAVKRPAVIDFFNHHVLSDEWFQIFTTEGAALRRLKVSSINYELGVVNFSNRNGELTLFLPLAQVFRDIIESRSHPVFDNAQFNRAREKLIHELDKMEI
ncbi:hypothetical protein A9404_01230 [Halothiobacillus diazotrophicus]|uniref:Thymidine phosphorylase n=1 Tax=Halothiobacillus diazotrophicus TaxID=1860122 RepID=A0A191ZE76_9GAMM|nr:DUF1631 family protein [Halothiobacillus diazotrophicus]ANJ66176.1 hypothetical protein A9404_01230 [Halothiobacillus diazotrophicus]